MSGIDGLTASELRVARLAAQGLTKRQIAQRLFVSMSTVSTHLGHVYLKLDVNDREGLTSAIGDRHHPRRMSTTRIHETFTAAHPPEIVFAFIVHPGNLATWQTIKTHVTPLTDGPTRLGSRFREGNRVGPRRWEQIVEVVEFEPDRVFAVRVIEGPASQGRWTITPEGSASHVRFEAEFATPALFAPIARRVLAHQFRGYHKNLRQQLETRRTP